MDHHGRMDLRWIIDREVVVLIFDQHNNLSNYQRVAETPNGWNIQHPLTVDHLIWELKKKWPDYEHLQTCPLNTKKWRVKAVHNPDGSVSDEWIDLHEYEFESRVGNKLKKFYIWAGYGVRSKTIVAWENN